MKWYLIVLVLFIFFAANGQTISTFAGGGTVVGDGGPATAAYIGGGNGAAFDQFGNYYVCEISGHRVRKISPLGIIFRVAGTGSSGYSGDGMPATAAQLDNPTAVLLDTAGNIYISDLNNFRIRKVDAVTGIITTFAGTGVAGFNGDGIPATDAQLGGVEDIRFDRNGNMYLADYVNRRVRKISTSGIISTFAGTGVLSVSGTGDGGPATAATFNWVSGIAIDHIGNVYISDWNGAKIRKVDTAGIISTIAGTGVYSYIGDGIPATAAQLNPIRLTFDLAENLVIADKANHRILKIDNAGIIHSIAGNGGTGFSGDGGPATAATFDFPAGVAFDTCGNLYISESNNGRVRKVTFDTSCHPYIYNPLRVNEKVVGEIELYPNPVATELIVSSSNKIAGITISTLVGKTFFTQLYNTQKAAINIAPYPAGIYLVTVTDNEGRKTVKRIVKE